MFSSFHISIPDEVIEDLQHRLRRARWPDQLAGVRWDFGTDLTFMKEVTAYWLDRYDWRNEERKLNAFSHFLFQQDGLKIHFIHERGHGPEPLPLIITHGWPGSFVEMIKILPLLTHPAAHGGSPEDAFDVIVPSLPGYGFSDRPTRRGMNVFEIARLWVNLMLALGYPRFGTQGGDWGSWVSTALGLSHGDHLLGIHLNYISTGFRPDLGPNTPPLSAEEKSYMEKVAAWREAEGAYFAIQGTKPQTLSYALTDSPVGLAAWLIEKFRGWSDCTNSPEEAFSIDELLTNVMIYWVTQTAHSSMRLYSESRQRPLHLSAGQRISAPTGVAVFPREIAMPPRSWFERAFNVVHWSQLPRGGHFAAMEQPELLARDIRDFFRPIRQKLRVQEANGSPSK